MRNRLIVVAVIVVVLLGGALGLARSGNGGANTNGSSATSHSPQPTVGGTGGLDTRIATAGAVTVAIEPLRIDATGAVFQVSLDTHSGDLSVDLEREASLVIDGSEWPAASWTGDPPGGHHRGGELRFEPAGAVSGEATLTIGGLSEPVEASWTLGS